MQGLCTSMVLILQKLHLLLWMTQAWRARHLCKISRDELILAALIAKYPMRCIRKWLRESSRTFCCRWEAAKQWFTYLWLLKGIKLHAVLWGVSPSEVRQKRAQPGSTLMLPGASVNQGRGQEVKQCGPAGHTAAFCEVLSTTVLLKKIFILFLNILTQICTYWISN